MSFDSEDDYKLFLEKEFFPSFFDDSWDKEYPVRVFSYYTTDRKSKERIDYHGLKDGIHTYIEVKNERIRQKYLLQIVKYYCEIAQEHHHRKLGEFNLYVICKHKIRPHREDILNKLGIIILDEEDIHARGLDRWM